MNITFYIAKRYLFAKKSHNIINIISLISVFGVLVGTAALIIVLSVFNGFENMVVNMFNSFNPDLKITPKAGKTFSENTIKFEDISKIDGILYITKVLEENVLIKYREKQYIATVKAVSNEFHHTSRIDSMIIQGESVLERQNANFALLGQGISYYLGYSLNDFENPLTLYVPRRIKTKTIDPTEAFNSKNILASGIFSIQQDYDQKYIIVPLRFGKQLMDYENNLSALEIKTTPRADIKRIKKNLSTILGDAFVIKDRYEQEELLFKIMKSEKLAVFLILSFILVVATFNVIGSLSMLILDKRKDIAILKSLGASERTIRKIFFTEGMMITLSGALLGLFIGGIICWLQLEFGFITIGNNTSFAAEAYPVKILFTDFIYVLIIVGLIGFFAAWLPVRFLSKKHLEVRLA